MVGGIPQTGIKMHGGSHHIGMKEVVSHGLLMKLQVWRHLVQARRADNGPNLVNTYIL